MSDLAIQWFHFVDVIALVGVFWRSVVEYM